MAPVYTSAKDYQMTTTEIILDRRKYGIGPIMYWSSRDGVWIECAREDDVSLIDRSASKVVFSDGLVWHPDEQCFTVMHRTFVRPPLRVV